MAIITMDMKTNYALSSIFKRYKYNYTYQNINPLFTKRGNLLFDCHKDKERNHVSSATVFTINLSNGVNFLGQGQRPRARKKFFAKTVQYTDQSAIAL